MAVARGVQYVGVAGGEANPHHKFCYPGHSAPWLFVIDSRWRSSRHVRFQKFYGHALMDFDSVQEEHSGRNVSITFEALDAALSSCCDLGPSAKERELQIRIVVDWDRLFGTEFKLLNEWWNTSLGNIPDLVVEQTTTRHIAVIELKAVHSGLEVVRQLDRYQRDKDIRDLSPEKPILGAVIAPSYQRGIISAKPPIRLYKILENPLRIELVHDGWGIDSAPISLAGTDLPTLEAVL